MGKVAPYSNPIRGGGRWKWHGSGAWSRMRKTRAARAGRPIPRTSGNRRRRLLRQLCKSPTADCRMRRAWFVRHQQLPGACRGSVNCARSCSYRAARRTSLAPPPPTTLGPARVAEHPVSRAYISSLSPTRRSGDLRVQPRGIRRCCAPRRHQPAALCVVSSWLSSGTPLAGRSVDRPWYRRSRLA